MDNQKEIEIEVIEKEAFDFDGNKKTLKFAFSNYLEKIQSECSAEELPSIASSFFAELSRKEFNYYILPLSVGQIFTDEDEVYNEATLATLRKIIQQAEGSFAFGEFVPILILPECKKDEFQFELLTACLKHTARRLKKEKSICGFVFDESLVSAVKDEKARQFFADELLPKHPDYKFYRIESAK